MKNEPQEDQCGLRERREVKDDSRVVGLSN